MLEPGLNMNSSDIQNTLYKFIKQIAAEQSLAIQPLENSLALVDDLGFRSIDIATLVAMLEQEFNVDPFMEGNAAITDIRTVGDICQVYIHCLSDHN